MNYYKKYQSPLGEITLCSDGEYLTALCFDGSKSYTRYVQDGEKRDLPIFTETIRWLDLYFQGKDPGFTPKYKRYHETSFRRDVAEEMLKIPYGQTTTYGNIAKAIAKKRGLPKMSAQAVGGAVGWNPICIIIPCHRVVGADDNLTGYSGGMNNKIGLLKLEGVDLTKFH